MVSAVHRAFLAVLATLSFAAGTSVARAAEPTLGDAVAAILQTDGPRAIRLFEQVERRGDGLTDRDRRVARCALARLKGEVSIPLPMLSGDPLADLVIDAYRRYWREGMRPDLREKAEASLLRALRTAIRRPDLKDADAVLTEVSEQLSARKIHTSQGKTATLYDLLLYLDEEAKPYHVTLSDGTTHDTTVFFMREFVSHGWSRYFTCGRTGTGGFATDAGLYAVTDQYDLDGEEFLVSFLAHETRHYADYKLYPGMEGPELEYRAKLTELALVDKTMGDVLSLFASDQGDDRGTPHSYANKRVLAPLRKRLAVAETVDLRTIDAARLREAARVLLIEDNGARDAAKRGGAR